MHEQTYISNITKVSVEFESENRDKKFILEAVTAPKESSMNLDILTEWHGGDFQLYPSHVTTSTRHMDLNIKATSYPQKEGRLVTITERPTGLENPRSADEARHEYYLVPKGLKLRSAPQSAQYAPQYADIRLNSLTEARQVQQALRLKGVKYRIYDKHSRKIEGWKRTGVPTA